MSNPTPQAKARYFSALKSRLFEGEWVTPTATISWRPDGVFTVHCWSCDWKAQSKDSAEVKHLAELH